MSKQRIADVLLRPDACQMVWCQAALHDSAEFDVVDTDFRRYLVKNWEKIYNTHSFEVLENNDGHIKVRLMCGQKDFYIAIDRTRYGNIRGYITSMNGYCCKFKQKSVNFRIELQF